MEGELDTSRSITVECELMDVIRSNKFLLGRLMGECFGDTSETKLIKNNLRMQVHWNANRKMGINHKCAIQLQLRSLHHGDL